MRTRPLWKRILFPLAAILVALSPFVLFEAACRIFDWGRPTMNDDPYVGFSSIHPLFELNEQTNRYEIPKSRLKFFCPESFAAKQANNEFRIFVLGGSTVQGRPYQKETSFTTWLELSLGAADPSRRWEVVNCGGISYASYRLIPILEEVLQHGPDLIVVCTGHNEFLEDRTYEHIKQLPGYLTWPHQQFTRLRTYNLLRGGYLSLSGGDETPSAERPLLGPEVDARLDWKGGLEQYHRDEEWRRGVQDHFAFNLQRMIDITSEAKVRLLFVGPISNLDWPPFKSEHRADLTDAEKQRFDELVQTTRDRRGGSLEKAIRLLQKAAAIDDRYAILHYRIGKRYHLLHMMREAKAAYEKALAEDICPLRILVPMRRKMQQIAENAGTPWIDAHALIVERSPGGIPGSRWLEDHVHPTLGGHQLIANNIVDEMQRQKMVKPAPSWTKNRDKAWRKHIENLNPSYFAHGLERLKGLKRWAYGRVELERK